MIDTHAHLYSTQFDADRDAMIARAREAGVEKILLPNIDSETIGAMHDLAQAYPDYCFPMMGLHPVHVKENYREELAIVEDYLKKGDYIAVGEIGVDLYWDTTYKKEQIEAFLTQAEWAKELGLPIAIHARNSMDLLIDLVREIKDDRLRGVFHCFTGTAEQAGRIESLGFKMGIGGVLTFKNSNLAEALRAVAPESLVLETDAPYLAPHPLRGKRNESAYTKYVLERLAEVYGKEEEWMENTTNKAAETLFFRKRG